MTAPLSWNCLKYAGLLRIAFRLRKSVTGMCAALNSSAPCGSCTQPSSMVRKATFCVVGICVIQAADGPAGTVSGSAGGAGGNLGMCCPAKVADGDGPADGPPPGSSPPPGDGDIGAPPPAPPALTHLASGALLGAAHAVSSVRVVSVTTSHSRDTDGRTVPRGRNRTWRA